MEFSFSGQVDNEKSKWFADGLRQVMEANGHTYADEADTASLVVNFIDQENPRPFRRRAQAIFVASVAEVDLQFERPVHEGYPLLVRSLSNVLIAHVQKNSGEKVTHFLTLEQGHWVFDAEIRDESYFQRVYERIHPLATSRLVIDNIYDPDLSEELRSGDEATEAICRAGRKLDELDLLPTPFPMKEVLSERDQKHVLRLYGIGGLSYGNLSARLDKERFWMSASGVDKSNLREIGRDILLVKDYDAENNAMVLSVPPNVEPRRVSVDAIEHFMIYREHPEVGAILHVHAWMEDIDSTQFNFPCGTRELGLAVANIVREAPDPSRCVVGLRNHGVTITGHSMDEIFERVDGKLIQPVPMS